MAENSDSRDDDFKLYVGLRKERREAIDLKVDIKARLGNKIKRSINTYGFSSREQYERFVANCENLQGATIGYGTEGLSVLNVFTKGVRVAEPLLRQIKSLDPLVIEGNFPIAVV